MAPHRRSFRSEPPIRSEKAKAFLAPAGCANAAIPEFWGPVEILRMSLSLILYPRLCAPLPER